MEIFQQLIDLLRRFHQEYDRLVELFTRAHGLNRTDLNAVAHIWRAAEDGRPLTPGELARILLLSPAATTALLGRLERAGHIERNHDTADRRRVHLDMRPSAQALALAFLSPLGEHLRAVFDEFDEEELDTLRRVMTRIVAATSTAADEAGQPVP